MAITNTTGAAPTYSTIATQTDPVDVDALHHRIEPRETTLEERTQAMHAARHGAQHPLQNARVSTDLVTPDETFQVPPMGFFSREAHRNERTGELAEGKFDVATQTGNDSIRQISYQNVKGLFKGVDNQISIGLEQDSEMAREFAAASRMPSPAGTKASDCICLPPDLMAYRLEDGSEKGYTLQYNCPEINGTGFGGIRDIPPQQLDDIMSGYRRAGSDIATECRAKSEVPLVIVANSGREGAVRKPDGTYPESSNSKMIWEKAYVADVIAEGIGTEEAPVFADSLDKFITQYYVDIGRINADTSLNNEQKAQAKDAAYAAATERMAQHKDEPLVLLGYSRDVAACCKIENGVPHLFGRPVQGAVNDRALQNLALTEGKSLDFKKFSPMNATIEEGVDKFAAAMARAEFLQSPDFAALPGIAQERGFEFQPRGLEQVRHFPKGAVEDLGDISDFEKNKIRSTYFRGVGQQDASLEDVKAAWDEFDAIGMKPLFKPNGSGQSKGIIAPEPDETWDQFKTRFEDNLKTLERDFGKGAGYPFMVMPLLKLDETPENEAYDLRYATYQSVDGEGNASLHSIPLILKKEPPKAAPSTGALTFNPTNVTRSVAQTGGKGTDFLVALSSKKGMEESGLSKDEMKSMGLYFAAFQSWLLKTKYSRLETTPSSSAGASSDSLDQVPGGDVIGRTFPNAKVTTNFS